MQKVVKTTWAWIALDWMGATSERARALKLICGHTVYRRCAWRGRTDPDTTPGPKMVRCEICAGKQPRHRLAKVVEREHYLMLKRRHERVR